MTEENLQFAPGETVYPIPECHGERVQKISVEVAEDSSTIRVEVVLESNTFILSASKLGRFFVSTDPEGPRDPIPMRCTFVAMTDENGKVGAAMDENDAVRMMQHIEEGAAEAQQTFDFCLIAATAIGRFAQEAMKSGANPPKGMFR